jgi:hypothetical protein
MTLNANSFYSIEITTQDGRRICGHEYEDADVAVSQLVSSTTTLATIPILVASFLPMKRDRT